jgi:hypothetical protein
MSDPRITELTNKIAAYQALTPTDAQHARSIADAVLTASEELRRLRGPNFPQPK